MDVPVRTGAPVESLWHLKPVGAGRFHGWCRDGALRRIFGGQVVAQALAAAGAGLTPQWCPRSLHAYFVREGRSAEPVEYRVEPVGPVELVGPAGPVEMVGPVGPLGLVGPVGPVELVGPVGSVEDPGVPVRLFRVTASQAGRPILVLDTAYAQVEGDWPPPGPSADDDAAEEGWVPVGDEARWLADRARTARFDFRFVDPPSMLAGRRGEVSPGQRLWLRASEPLPDEVRHHACALAYASDLFLVSTALARHGLPGGRVDIQAATIDHAVWFHRLIRADDWFSYEQASPSSTGARGLSTGRIVDRSGRLAATVRQEVLLRVGG